MGRFLHKIALYSIVIFFIITSIRYGWEGAFVLTTIAGVPTYMLFRGLGLAR